MKGKNGARRSLPVSPGKSLCSFITLSLDIFYRLELWWGQRIIKCRTPQTCHKVAVGAGQQESLSLRETWAQHGATRQAGNVLEISFVIEKLMCFFHASHNIAVYFNIKIILARPHTT